MSYKDNTTKYAEIGRRMREIPQEKTASSYEWIKQYKDLMKPHQH